MSGFWPLGAGFGSWCSYREPPSVGLFSPAQAERLRMDMEMKKTSKENVEETLGLRKKSIERAFFSESSEVFFAGFFSMSDCFWMLSPAGLAEEWGVRASAKRVHVL